MKETVWEVWDYAPPSSYWDDDPVVDPTPYLVETCTSREEADKQYDYYQDTRGGDHRIFKVTRKQVRG